MVISSTFSALVNIAVQIHIEIMNEPTKHIGLVTASPAQFLVHQRLGRTKFLGRGVSVFTLPWIDRYWLIPSSVQAIAFCADQITAENQGVEISGFAIWSVQQPEKAVEAVDFNDPAKAVERIGSHLREVVESAIRHQVANLTLEDTLRKRASIIDRLKGEISEVAERWGLEIVTVEIKTVRIMSGQTFENLQAKYRNGIRLESEKSDLETREIIARENARVREQAARRDMEFKKAEAERAEMLKRSEIERETELSKLGSDKATEGELARLDAQLRLLRGREENQREAAAFEHALLDMEQALAGRRFEFDQVRASNRQTIAEIDNAIERTKFATANTRDTSQLLVENLPAMLAGVKIGEMNLGDPVLADAISRLTRSFGSGKQTGGNQ
jgi:hypothetical protein